MHADYSNPPAALDFLLLRCGLASGLPTGQEAGCNRYLPSAISEHLPPTAQDLTYTVWNSANKKQKITLLTEVSGFMPPGHLSALMGPSGSSKTTLLGALIEFVKPLVSAELFGSLCV